MPKSRIARPVKMYKADFIAGCAELAMLLEVSATPKPGNVDRTHDFKDLTYEHFIGSAVGIFPVLRQAALRGRGIGTLVRNAVDASATWQTAGNCHFGAILLLMPLCAAASRSSTISQLRTNAIEVVENTTTADAVHFYESFRRVNVRVREGHYLDVNDLTSVKLIEEQNLTLRDVMRISRTNDSIARELVEGFPRTFRGAEMIRQFRTLGYDLNSSIVYLFLNLLREAPDTLIAKKFGSQVALEVSTKANDALKFGTIEEFDDELIAQHINPGATADIVIGSLFVALLAGLRF